MYPSLISIGPFNIRFYGLMLAIAFLTGILFAAHRAKKAGVNPDHIYDLSIWIMFSSFIGARIYYVATHYHEFKAEEHLFVKRLFIECKNMFWPVSSTGKIGIDGLVLYGGFIAATVVTVMYLSRHKLNVPKFLDIIAPSLGSGIFFTRIGCFLNGCCFGKPTESFLGVCFPENSIAGMFSPHTTIHPSQLYHSLSGLIIFISLLFLERYKRFDGFTALLFFIFYTIARFIIDFSRYYESNLTFFGLSHNQIISIIIFIIAVSLFSYFSRKAYAVKSSIQR